MARPNDPISQAIWRAYAREAVTLRQLMDEVQAVAGSGRKAAKLVGVGETTWRRWRSGDTTPKPENFTKLDWAFRGVRVDNAGPLNPATVKIKTTDKNDPNRHRTVNGNQLRLGPLDRVADAYRAGDPERAARAFLGAIRESWYRGYFAASGPDAAPGDEYGGIVDSIEF